VARGFQDRQVAGQVGALVGERVVDRVAHAGLGGQVDDALGAAGADQLHHRRVVGDVQADHGEARPAVETGGAGGLEGRVVVVVEDVDADHRLAAVEQALGHVHADETRGAGDDDRRVAHAPRPIEA
jgi:hypothetical protein